MGRQSQPCLEQSHHHEVHGSYWVTPCLRIVGPLRCRIWYTRCTSYCFFPGPHSFPTPLAQYSRPRSTPPTSVVTFCPSAPAGSCPSTFCFSTCSFSICPCTSSNCCTTLKPVPCS